VRALVSATDVVEVVTTHIDRVNDAALRLGCSTDEAYEVTVTAAMELVEDLAQQPETVGDLVGGLYARCRQASARVRRGAAAPSEVDVAPEGLLADDAEALAAADALFDLPERRRLGVLLVDSYAVTYAQTAVALDLDIAETARTIALGRAALVEAVDRRVAPSLSGHDTAIGDLGQLSDGSAPAGGRFAGLRRHVSSCATCAENLGVQTRGKAMVRVLPVLALPDPERAELLARVSLRAEAMLLSAEQVQAELAGEIEAEPLIPRFVWVLALIMALLLGGGLGALLIQHNSSDGSVAALVPSSSAPAVTSAAIATTSSAPVSSSSSLAASTSSTLAASPSSAAPTRVATSTPAASTSRAAPTTSAAVAPPATTLSISPTSGPTGTTVTVSGTGFSAAALVTVTYERSDGTAEGSAQTTTTDGTGAFTLTITADDPPTLLGASNDGPHQFVATSNGHTASAAFDQMS
jgi:hypothetical protein